ncbi:MAG TPA: hypothetical protein VHM64_02730, partial [Candidatus Binatia bacterium]|nr:hypothetical protein [Candidatus Binatia bacterium]
NALSSQDSAVGPAELNLFREVLANAKSSTEAWNGKLYFVYLPEWDRYGRPESANKHREAVLRFVEELNIPVVDLDRAFQARGDPLSLFPFRRFGHYNEEGNRVVAETVLAQIAPEAKE